MPRAHLTYPTLDVVDANGVARPTFSQADRISLFSWILEQLSWLPQYDTVYVLVDNRQLAGANPPDYWPLLAPWIQARCTVVGPFAETTTAIHFPINTATGLQQVRPLHLGGRPRARGTLPSPSHGDFLHSWILTVTGHAPTQTEDIL